MKKTHISPARGFLSAVAVNERSHIRLPFFSLSISAPINHKIFSGLLTIVCLFISSSLFAQYTSVVGGATSSGNLPWISPAGVISVGVQVWGAGGAGGGATTNGKAGGGGGGGEQKAVGSITITGGTTYTMTVGSGGVGSTTAGQAGGSTTATFGATTVTAQGGMGGGLGSTTNGAGGNGAAVATTVGGNGAAGNGSSKIGGGGGGGAGGGTGSTSGSAASSVTGGSGGAGANPGGAGGNGANGGNNNTTGNAGSWPGGGGGGAYRKDASVAGGNGANGEVIISYSCPTYSIATSTSASSPVCPGSPSTITITSTAAAMPNGTYTVTYSLSGANTSTGNTATMTATSGTGSFVTSALANSGTTTIKITYLQSGSGTGCTSALVLSPKTQASITVYSPNITTTGSIAPVCYSTSAQTTTMPYTASANSSYSYSIDWDATANAAGLADQGATAFSFNAAGGTLTGINVPASLPANTYNGTMSVVSSVCTYTVAVSFTVSAPPTITTSGSASACYSTSAQTTTLAYSATTNSPTSYSIDWDAAANAAGLADQSSTSFAFVSTGGTMTGIAVPASLPTGTYNGTLTVKTAIGCTSTGTAITLTVGVTPVVYPQPADIIACTKSTITFVSGAGTPSNVSSYQWQYSPDNITWTNISGANSANYTISSVASTDAGYYRLVLTGLSPTYCVVSSNAAQLFTSVSTSTTWTDANFPSNAWEDNGNWSCGVPDLSTNAIVPVVVNAYPTIKAAVIGSAKDLNIQANAYVTVIGKLQVAGTITNNGELDATAGTVEFIGSATQTIAAGTFANSSATNTVENLIISNNVNLSGTLNLAGALSFGNVNNKTFATGTKNLTLKSGSAKTARVADMTNSGANSGNSISGTVWIERYIPQLAMGRRWRLLTVPVISGISINDAWQEARTWNGVTPDVTNPGYGTLITGGAVQGSATTANSNGFDWWTLPSTALASVRRYAGASVNTGAKWIDLTTTKDNTAFNSAQAYLLYVRGDRSYSTGTSTIATILRAAGPLRQGSVPSLTIYGSATQTHTLLGNPYASPLDFYKFYADASNRNTVAGKQKIQNRFWLLNASWGTGSSLGAYELVFSTTGSNLYEGIPLPFDTTTRGTGTAAAGLIHSGSGFFVEPSVSTDDVLYFKETHKSDGTTDPSISVFRTARSNNKPAKLYVNLSVRNSGGTAQLLDGALARWDASFNDEGSDDNISKFINGGENLSFYKGGNNLIVSSASAFPKAGDTLYLRVWNTTARTYLLETKCLNFGSTGLEAFMIDKYAGTQTPLLLNDAITPMDISVTSDPASKDPLRFFIVFKQSITLPLVLTSLQAAEVTGGVQVTWKIENESGVKAYELQRSTDATNFAPLTQLSARGTGAAQEYNYLDATPSAVNYYRVKMIGTGGEMKYSETVKLTLHEVKSGIRVQPNPVTGASFNLQLLNKPKGAYTITLYNPLGQQIMQDQMQHPGGSLVKTFYLSRLVASGQYALEVKANNGVKEVVNVSVIH